MNFLDDTGLVGCSLRLWSLTTTLFLWMDKVNLALDLDDIGQDSTRWTWYTVDNWVCLLSQFEFESYPSWVTVSILHDSHLVHDLHYLDFQNWDARPRVILKTMDLAVWWPHSLRTQGWLAWDTFIIINGTILIYQQTGCGIQTHNPSVAMEI